ncbi:TlpA disulfide reductase family protein [Aquimarina brevivitae]|uniref:Peroxiredoxin n=1 Tax=Aquimarina brevivitae TaxID=323412 RepID=A0A4Q7P1R8_9FLAO|nr:TlpA disulfide reductase family protein [Aquimarina brevivitae]RZS92592.1 peroxiredoxin [Aquimarina brevivitae]
MKKNLLLTLPIVLLCTILSCKKEGKRNQNTITENTDQYVINAEIEGLKDGTKIYLNRNNELIDSTKVKNESFQFKGTINEPDLVYLHVKQTQDFYTSFWLENEEISITGKKSDFKDLKINGGPIQKSANQLDILNAPLIKTLDEIQNAFNNPDIEVEKLDSLGRLQMPTYSKLRENSKNFIKKHPNSFLSVYLLNMNKMEWEKDSVNLWFANLNKNIKESSYGQIIDNYLSLPDKPQIGEAYVDFELPNTNGDQKKISDLKSKYTLVEFWASWCAPCRQENPNLIEAYKNYKNKGFEIVGVSLDKRKEDWLKAIEQDKLPWTQLSDFKEFESYPALVYSINYIPYNFLIDENGIIVGQNLRGERLDKKLTELLGS